MSHVTEVVVSVVDLEALKAAVLELGCEFREGQRTYAWFGQSVGDYPVPAGIRVEDLGKCDHAVHVPGVEYEVGLVRQASGAYRLAFDFWGPGQGLVAKFGDGCKRLVQTYAKHAATRAFQKRGYTVTQVAAKGGAMRLQVTRGW